MGRYLCLSGCLVLLLLTICLSAAGAAHAQPPQIPHRFYGTVVIGDSPAAAGATVSARINGVEVASTTTDSQGRYGYGAEPLLVSGSNGATVEFYVNGVKAQQTYTLNSGSMTELNLTVGSGTPPPPPPPPSPPAPPPPTPPSPPPQPPSTPTGTRISASLLGTTATLNLSQSGVLASATTLASADGAVKLSLRANTTVTIQGTSLSVSAEPTPPSPPSGARLIAAYKFSPSGTSFSPAATLTLKYDPTTLPAGIPESALYISRWDGSSWSRLPSTVDTVAKTVSAEVSHFSIYAILGESGAAPPPAPAPSPASFSVTDLKVAPVTVKPGETVTITATVTNSGGSAGTYRAVLEINGTAEAEKEIALDAGKTTAISFTITRDKAGGYQVSIADRSASFEVVAPETAKRTPGTQEWLVIGALIIGVLVIVLTVLALIRSRQP